MTKTSTVLTRILKLAAETLTGANDPVAMAAKDAGVTVEQLLAMPEAQRMPYVQKAFKQAAKPVATPTPAPVAKPAQSPVLAQMYADEEAAAKPTTAPAPAVTAPTTTNTLGAALANKPSSAPLK